MLADSDIHACSILAIDDEPANVELVKRVLGRAGFTSIATATDPSEGIALFRRLRPHVVLLDLRMPGLDGFSVLGTLAPDLQETGSAVLVLTGEGDPSNKLKALKLGAHDYIGKPFEPHELTARVRNACATQE